MTQGVAIAKEQSSVIDHDPIESLLGKRLTNLDIHNKPEPPPFELSLRHPFTTDG